MGHPILIHEGPAVYRVSRAHRRGRRGLRGWGLTMGSSPTTCPHNQAWCQHRCGMQQSGRAFTYLLDPAQTWVLDPVFSPHTQRTTGQEPGLWTGWGRAEGSGPLSQGQETQLRANLMDPVTCLRVWDRGKPRWSVVGYEVNTSVPSHSQGRPRNNRPPRKP